MKYTSLTPAELRKLRGIEEPKPTQPAKSLPERFSVSTPELALAVVAWHLEKKGRLECNMTVRGFTEIHPRGPYVLRIVDGKLSHYSDRLEASVHFTTIAEFLAVANSPQLPSIGTHGKPKLTPKGLVVGCTTVPWADFDVITDAVAKYRKEKA